MPAAELNPPPIPVAESYEQAQDWVTNNAFYAQTAPAPVRCEVPPIDVATADDALLKSHFESLMECLVRVWQPPVTQAGFQIYRPTVTIYDEEITTKCGSGKLPQNAFYCGADQQIYWSSTLGPVLAPFSESQRAGDEVMAHEFGHAIQGRSGILTSKNWIALRGPGQARRPGGRPAKRDPGRLPGRDVHPLGLGFARACSSPMWSRSSRTSPTPVTTWSAASPTSSGNHGRSPSRRYWGTMGLTTGEAGRCNTYVAPPNWSGERLVR